MNEIDISERELGEKIMGLDLIGDMSIYNAAELRKVIQKLIERGYMYYVLNFERMNQIDSAGIGVLFALSSKVKKMGGTVSIVNANAHIYQVFEMTRVNAMFTLCESEETALATISSR